MKYLTIQQTGTSQSGKTKVFQVRGINQRLLGEIKWYVAWRKYCFFPCYVTIFDSNCLTEILAFLVIENETKKNANN